MPTELRYYPSTCASSSPTAALPNSTHLAVAMCTAALHPAPALHAAPLPLRSCGQTTGARETRRPANPNPNPNPNPNSNPNRNPVPDPNPDPNPNQAALKLSAIHPERAHATSGYGEG